MQLSRRLAKIHPDKVVATLQEHISAGHEQAALQAIPELQLRHPGFHNELEQIKQRLSDKLLDDVKVLNRDAAVIFRCLNCGSGLARQAPETVHVICHYCGCDAEHPASDIGLERWNNSIDLEANFTIGDFFTFEGKRWQAVGVQLFSGRVREFNREDGWESSYSRYTNWWMLNEQRELAWLIDDGRRRYWSQKHIPDDPSLPNDKDKQFEHGSWTLEFAAGEFSYQPRQQEQHLSAESRQSVAVGKKRFFNSVESRLADGQVSEVEFFRSQMVPHEDVLAGLDKKSELIDSQRWKRTMKTLLLAIPLLAAAFLYFNRGGESSVETVALSNQDKQVEMQALPVAEQGQLLEMKGSVNGIANNSWFGVDLTLIDSDNEEVYSKYLEFWRESGIDSDGHWSEARNVISWFVRIDEPDTYRVVINGDEQSSTSDADFRLSIEKNKASITPFIIAGFFTMLLILMSRSKASAIRAGGASIGLRFNQGQSKATGSGNTRASKTAKEAGSGR